MSKVYPCIYCTDDLKCTRWPDEAMNFCVLGPCKYEKPSNGDKIRAMSDEELAEWLDERCDYAPTFGWLEWMKKEADNG